MVVKSKGSVPQNGLKKIQAKDLFHKLPRMMFEFTNLSCCIGLELDLLMKQLKPGWFNFIGLEICSTNMMI